MDSKFLKAANPLKAKAKLPEYTVKRLVVGLTGGVGSGKSTIAEFFRNRGARILDADAIGHRVLDRPDVRSRIVKAWGRGVLDGKRVDRAALARLAFRSKAAVRRLNRLVHPAIFGEIRRRIGRARGWVVVDAALLYEAGADRLCDRVVFVDAPLGVRRRRTLDRGWRPGELEKRERFQWPTVYKKRRADYVIYNAGPKSHAKDQARRVCREFRRLLNPAASHL